MKKIICLLCLAFLPITAAEESNVLLYTDPVQVNAEVSTYEALEAEKPITGTIMITHDTNLKVDEGSFRMGNESLKVKLVNQVQMSSTSKLVITIYEFEIPGKPTGAYNLPPITVNVGGTVYQAPPLNVTIP